MNRKRLATCVAFGLAIGLAKPAVAQSVPAPAPAKTLVEGALSAARAANKIVLIEFGASWCTWCRNFDAFVHAPEVANIVSANYVVANLVVQERDDKKALENPGGDQYLRDWGGEKSGLPFYVFLTGDGKKIADSNAMQDGTNVGFPGNPNELKIFLGLIDKTAPRLPAGDRVRVVDYLTKVVDSIK